MKRATSSFPVVLAVGLFGCGSESKNETPPPAAVEAKAEPAAEWSADEDQRGSPGAGAGFGAPAPAPAPARPGGRSAKVPEIIAGTAQVRGALDKEVIRRVVRRHLEEVKFCYQKALVRKPDLYGRIMIQFTIDGSGRVVASLVQQSNLDNAELDREIAACVRRWEFPKPHGGGVVIVSYPFALKPVDVQNGGR